MTLAEYKKLFFQSGRLHFNNAGLSPVMKPSHDEVNYWIKRFYEEGYYSDHDYMNRVAWARQQIAGFVDCDAAEISFYQSCAWGISQFAFGIGLQKNDEVILFDQEYASNLYPWQQACKRAGASLKVLDSNDDNSVFAEQIIAAITESTKVIAVSFVQFQTGAMLDLQKISQICQSKNILFFVDAIQGVGVHPISFKKLNIDGLVCGSHKWLNAPVGASFLVTKKELIAKLQPIAIGSGTYGTCDDPSDFTCVPKMDATKFEAGSKQVLEICAMARSIEVIQDVGVDVIRAEIFRLADILRTEITKVGFKVYSHTNQSKQFIAFSKDLPEVERSVENKKLQKYLKANGVDLPIRGPGVRITPHALNTDEDVFRFVEILKAY